MKGGVEGQVGWFRRNHRNSSDFLSLAEGRGSPDDTGCLSTGVRLGPSNHGVGLGRNSCTNAGADFVTVRRTLDHTPCPVRRLLPAAGEDEPTIHLRPGAFSLRAWYSEDPPLIRHRTATLILALSGLMLSACASGSPARPETGEQVVRERLAAADDAPYSAALRAVTQSGPTRLQLMVGRINLNTPLTGRTTEQTEQYAEDVVITQQKVYRRASGTPGVWQEFPASAAKGGIPVDRLPQYVHLMLGHSASIHQGSEPVRVSARLTPKDIESVDKAVGRNLGPATTIDAEAWIDEKGRVVRVRQEMHFASNPDIQGTLTLTDFKSAISVSTPDAR